MGCNVHYNFNDGVPLGDSHDQDIPTMYSQWLDMSPDEMLEIRAGWSDERRNYWSESKRKKSGQQYEGIDLISNAMEVRNDN